MAQDSQVNMRIATRDIEVTTNHFVDEAAIIRHAWVFYAEQFSKGRVVNAAMIEVECEFKKWTGFECEVFHTACEHLDQEIDAGEVNFKWREHQEYKRRFDYENKPMRKGVIKILNGGNLHLRDKEVKPVTFMFRAFTGGKMVYNGNDKAHFDEWCKKYQRTHRKLRHVVHTRYSETFFGSR